jgi:hypothetical protein
MSKALRSKPGRRPHDDSGACGAGARQEPVKRRPAVNRIVTLRKAPELRLGVPGPVSNIDAISHKIFEEPLSADKSLILENISERSGRVASRVSADLWLISNPRIYLKGVLKHGNRAEYGGNPPK